MRKSLASGFGFTAALVVIFGSDVASANNEYVGMTYEQAVESINGWGGNPTIATRTGDYLPTEQCRVSGSRTGGSPGNRKVLLDLNCNDTSALNGHAGNSVTTPQGQKVLKARDWAKKMSDNYAQLTAKGETPQCGAEQKYIDWCTQICKDSGSCSAELQEYLGL